MLRKRRGGKKRRKRTKAIKTRKSRLLFSARQAGSESGHRLGMPLCGVAESFPA